MISPLERMKIQLITLAIDTRMEKYFFPLIDVVFLDSTFEH
jgi:hypothetical protein